MKGGKKASYELYDLEHLSHALWLSFLPSSMWMIEAASLYRHVVRIESEVPVLAKHLERWLAPSKPCLSVFKIKK